MFIKGSINKLKLYSLRPLNFDDKQYLLEWNRDKEIRDLTGAVIPASEYEHEIWFESISHNNHTKFWVIQSLETRNPIGVVGLKNIDYINCNAELFIYIGNKEFWGKGIGKDATKEILLFSFNTLNLRRVYLNVFEFNQRAIHSYEKIGFIKEGVLRKSKFHNGKYINKFIMGILKEDFKNEVSK